jgi:hypothetical protein
VVKRIFCILALLMLASVCQGQYTTSEDTMRTNAIIILNPPERAILKGMTNDTLRIFYRDSAGVKVIKAWLSRWGVWHNAAGDSAYYGTPTGGSAYWGGITGTLSAQTDLGTALSGKAATTR